MDDLQCVWVFLPRPACPLRYTDLLVYSYMARRDKWGQSATAIAISRATGVNRDTVSASIARLSDLGFVVENRPVRQVDYFFTKAGGDHWSDSLQFFKSYVRAESGPLSVSDCMVWSYLLHLSTRDRDSPPSHTYIANGVCMDARTVSSSIEHLQAVGLVRISDDEFGLPSSLTSQQTDYFCPKLQPGGTATPPRRFTTFTPTEQATPPNPTLRQETQSVTLREDTKELLCYLINQFSSKYTEDQYGPIFKGIRRIQPQVKKQDYSRYRDKLASILDGTRTAADHVAAGAGREDSGNRHPEGDQATPDRRIPDGLATEVNEAERQEE